MRLLSALISFALAQTRLVRGQTGQETPECSSNPDRVCSVREVESPRQECQEEYEDILDTTITRHCQEILTTTCTQTTKTSQLSSAVVGTDSKVVASGVLVSPPYSRGRRTAETSAQSAQSAPVCQSVPTKMCRETPVTSSRREVRRTCRLVREISVLEDCTETVTTQCVLRTTTVLHSQILEDPSAPDPPPASAPPAVAVAPPTPPTPGPPARPPLDFPE